MNQTEFFERLGAPLENSRWSWGAVRRGDGAVFLKVWRDLMRMHNGSRVAQVTFHARFRADPGNFRHQRRLQHVEFVQGGAACYLIECEVVDPGAEPRRVKWFNSQEIFPGGQVVEIDGDLWVEMRPALEARAMMTR